MEHAQRRPLFPRPLAGPIKLIPERIQGRMAAQVLNRVFAHERGEGELDFVEGRCVRVVAEDTGTRFMLCFEDGRFRAAGGGRRPDLSISGTLYDYLLLITGQEDPDTLFFQRRLRMQGDTGLGVYLKNFLASVDPASLPLGSVVQPLLNRGVNLYERLA